MTQVRVRFAPSPTGPLHIGGVRTALYNYLFARKNKGKFILRIEDTDQTRYVPGAEDYIQESMEWLGLKINEGPKQGGNFGPYRQSERKSIYKKYVMQLVDNDKAYYAFDTSEELTAMREKLKAGGMNPAYDISSRMSMKNSLTLSKDEVDDRLNSNVPYVVRIKLPRKEEVRFHDEIRGWVVFQTNQMDDKVLFKSDGMPTYHMANVVDDYLMKITHVIRGEEWLPSAPLHVMLYRYLGWEDTMPKFAHLPLILKPDGNGKLSKRDGDRLGFPVFPIEWKDPVTGEISSGYREVGYHKDAVLNMISLLGWHPSDNQEIFSLKELEEVFSLERVSKSGAKFDLNKALWFNQKYLHNKPSLEIYNLIKPLIEAANISHNQEYIQKVIILMKEKVTFAKDIIKEGTYFFNKPTVYDAKVVRKKWKDDVPQNIGRVGDMFRNLANFTAENIETNYRSFCENEGISPGKIMQPLRMSISGTAGGPPIFEMIELLGKKEVVSRINYAVKNIQKATK